MNEHLIAILNPVSGSSGEDYRAAIEDALKSRGIEFEIRETTPEIGGEQLAGEAVREGATHLLACGGDGTVMSVVNGVGKTDTDNIEASGERTDKDIDMPRVTLSIIPGGTANLLAQALKIPTDVDEAVAVAVAGEDRIIDLGRCGEHLFALGLGLGLTERLVSQASAEAKDKVGRWAYVWAMAKELGARPHTFMLKLDGKKAHRKRGVAVVVANAGEISGKIRFAPDARMNDGLIDVCILHRFYFRDVLRMTARSIFGKLRDDRAVSFYQAHRVEIRSDPPLDLQIDGEVVDQMVPLVAEVVPRALRVRVPAQKAEELDE